MLEAGTAILSNSLALIPRILSHLKFSSAQTMLLRRLGAKAVG